MSCKSDFFRLCIKRFQFPFSSSSEGIIFIEEPPQLRKTIRAFHFKLPRSVASSRFFPNGLPAQLTEVEKVGSASFEVKLALCSSPVAFFSLLIFLASLHVADATVEREFFFLLSVTSEVSNSINETPPPAKSFEEKKSRATKSLFFQLSISPRLS